MDKQSADGDAMLQADSPVTFKKSSTWLGRTQILALIVLVVGVILVIVGIALIASANKAKCVTSKDSVPDSKRYCQYSDEATRVGLGEFIDRVRNTYYKLHKYNVMYDPDLGTDFESFELVKEEFEPYDPTPRRIKERTDAAWELLKEINGKTIQVDQLKPRERKAIEQVKHYLKHVFGQPYDVNYYAGDWMLGPNLFCWQPICYMGYGLHNLLLYLKPLDLLDADLIQTKLKSYKTTVDQYVANMKLGITKGMIRSVDECKAGLNAISRNYLNISLYNETGVLKEWYTQPLQNAEYYSQLSEEMKEEWKKTHNNKNVSESMKEYLIEYIGKPITNMLRYLKEEHLPHCVPSTVSSGLASLPVKYVYTDGVANKSRPTDPTLPLTNKILDGKKTYEMIMPYFTTNNMTPDEVHQLGWKMLGILYPKVVEIAKQETKIHNDSALAVQKFREILNSSESYFDDPIPKNESDEDAHRKCSDLAGAEKYCPARWAAIQKWFKESRKVMSMLDPKIVQMFYFTGTKHTTPNCPIDMRPDLNPSSGAQSYDSSGIACTRSAIYNIPFFLGRMGPRYSEWSVNAHEARPGHHLQVQGSIEHFKDSCGGSIGWLDSETYYTAFTEGWALYAENPLIAEDTDTYKNEPMQKFGMLKWQLWRAIRLIVDTGLHYKGMNRSEALRLFDERAWDGTDLAQKEVTRYQSDPGQATAYMIGQLDIKKAREYATNELGKNFNLKEFHYQVLSQGSSPLGYLTDHIRRYVECKKDPSKTGCQDILSPPSKTSGSSGKTGRKKVPMPIIRPPKRHYI